MWAVFGLTEDRVCVLFERNDFGAILGTRISDWNGGNCGNVREWKQLKNCVYMVGR